MVTCPNCNEFVLIEKLNCKIFRHCVFKLSGIQIQTHATKEQCELYMAKKIIYGCGKPFKIVKDASDNFVTEICDYI